MIDDTELLQLLTDLESDRVERKESLADHDRIREAICAFANDLSDNRKPGILFIGAKNDGSCANLIITDQMLLTFADMRSDGNILPIPALSVQTKTLGGCPMIVIQVEPSDAPPVRFRGRTWVRVGPRRAVASAQEERILSEKWRSGDLPFDLRPVHSATQADLDLNFFQQTYLPNAVASEILEQNERSVEQQLRSLRLLTLDERPTILGVIVTGKDVLQFVPGAYIQFLRLDGDDLNAPIKDQKQIDGTLLEILQSLDEVFQAHISTATNITASPIEIQHPDYPLVALQQIARNAVMHRTYEATNSPVRITWFSDRIEIQSPGGPFGQVTRANFGSPGLTDYRNPHLAEAMKNLGYVQRFGFGLQLAQQSLKKNDNPPLEWKVEDTYVLFTLRKAL